MYLIASNRFRIKEGNNRTIDNPDDLFLMTGYYKPCTIFFPFWSWKIPPETYEKHKCIIFHMTDVPYGRGGMPLQNLLARGHKKTVISALECVEDFDAGGVYMKHGFDISFGTEDEIYKRAWDIITKAMIPYIVEHEPTPCPQIGETVIFRRIKDETNNGSGSPPRRRTAWVGRNSDKDGR